ncbi:MAG TPA: glycosyltransferase family 2 protein [Candidatus Acidoferrales bacterium]|nr:glycosyltransferase family 2 protein [Candidatus Acidoferrales bacterium]
MSDRAPALSVVVPVFNEAGNVGPLFTEIRDVMAGLGRPFEMIFVNDGSTDATLDQLRALAAGEARLRIIDLDGNFGEAAALSAGFRAARGDVLVTLDGDGQNDPHDIPRLLAALERNGCRVVSGWRQERQEGLLLRVVPSRLANGLIAAVSRIPVHDNGCGLKVYRRSVVERAALPRGMNRFVPAIFGVRADEVAEVPVNDRRRQHGQSHYGISRTLIVMRDLLALRFIIANPRRAEALWAVVTLAVAAAHLVGAWNRSGWLMLATAVVAVLASMIWWNLRRFNRAQRDGVFRVRCEYSVAKERVA